MRFLAPKIKILGIDDSKNHHRLCDVIFNDGYFSDFVYTGIDGVEACNGIKPNDFDVILIDWYFKDTPKDINGSVISKRINEEFSFTGKIIFVTGDSNIAKSLKEKGKLVIKKVFDPKQICQFIKDAVGNKIESCRNRLEDISNFTPKALM